MFRKMGLKSCDYEAGRKIIFLYGNMGGKKFRDDIHPVLAYDY
jgi:hypothetical protein